MQQTNHLTKQTLTQPNNKHFNQSTKQPLKKQIHQSPNGRNDQPINISTN